MSRSFRKRKIFGNTCANSEKQDKRFYNRRLRRRTKSQIEKGDFDSPFPIKDEVEDPWSMAKDGKHYWPDATRKDMSK